MPDPTPPSQRTLWTFGLPADDPAGAADALVQHDFSVVVLGTDAEQAPVAREAGLAVFASLPTFPVESSSGDEDLLAESALGGCYTWFGSGCPNAPELRARHLDQVQHLVASHCWDGVFLDGIRFASPHAGPDAFFTCFCRRCRVAAERLGYDFDRMRRDVGTLQRLARADKKGDLTPAAPIDLVNLLVHLPGVVDWLRFRADCIAEYVAAVRAVVSETPGKLLGAYLFSPSLAPLVGQDYPRLAPYLDVVSPMIYRQGDGDAVLASELASVATFLVAAGAAEPEAMALVASTIGLTLDDTAPTASSLDQQIRPAFVGAEMRRAARELGGYDKLVPIVWFDDPLLQEVIAECRNAAGLCLFLLTDATRARIGEAAEGWRGLPIADGARRETTDERGRDGNHR